MGEIDPALGITFYDCRGNGRRITLDGKQEQTELIPKPPKFDLAKSSLSLTRCDETVQLPPSHELIDELLEQNYREQEKLYWQSFNRLLLSSSPLASEALRIHQEHSKEANHSSLTRSQSLKISPNITPTESLDKVTASKISNNQTCRTTSTREKSPLRLGQHNWVPHRTRHRIFSAPVPASSNNHPLITNLVSKPRSFEPRVMSSLISSEERQKIINNNRSLRIIKNELESLAEHGGISDQVYDSIMSALPAESPLNACSRLNAVKQDNSSSSSTSAPLDAATNTLQNLSLSKDQNPPSYSTSTPPSLPSREQQSSPTRPELVRVTGLYRYSEPGDCNFEVGDQIAVYQYMNPDWWFGKNLRTGQEGVFPQNYVRVAYQPAQSAYNNEKAAYSTQYNQQVAQPSTPYYNQAPPAQASNPYNSSVPPMQVAEQPVGNSAMGKGGEMGKKLGKKLGNAAIFGAGATIGGNIVNSIF